MKLYYAVAVIVVSAALTDETVANVYSEFQRENAGDHIKVYMSLTRSPELHQEATLTVEFKNDSDSAYCIPAGEFYLTEPWGDAESLPTLIVGRSRMSEIEARHLSLVPNNTLLYRLIRATAFPSTWPDYLS